MWHKVIWICELDRKETFLIVVLKVAQLHYHWFCLSICTYALGKGTNLSLQEKRMCVYIYICVCVCVFVCVHIHIYVFLLTFILIKIFVFHFEIGNEIHLITSLFITLWVIFSSLEFYSEKSTKKDRLMSSQKETSKTLSDFTDNLDEEMALMSQYLPDANSKGNLILFWYSFHKGTYSMWCFREQNNFVDVNRHCDGKLTKIPKRDFIFARVKTGQVGTWSPIE